MKAKKVIVAYSNTEDRKKLEDYIEEAKGRRIDLGPIGYDGKLTIQTMNTDLTNISTTNITCAACFPGMRFGNVDEFIEWHRRIIEMHYLEALRQAKEHGDIIALFYDEEKDSISYICFRMFDKQDIEKYLVSSDGKAISIRNGKTGYWLLMSNANGNMILFENTGRDDIKFSDIHPGNNHVEFFRYLISTNR